MKIRYNRKRSVKASNEGRSDLLYVIMVNGDPVAKGSYDAMVKKSYTYNFPVQMLKFPKAKLNSLIKMAKDVHRPDPLKFAVNRFINDNTSEYDSLNASTNRNNVTASTKPSYRSGEEAIRNACNVINVFFAGREPDMWDDLYNDTNTKYFVDQHKDRSGGIDTESVVQEWRETYDEAYDPRDYLFNILRDQLGYSYDEAERMLIYASTRRRPVRAARTIEILTYDELTPEQQQYVIDNWSNMPKLAEVIYEWHSEDEMFVYNDEVQFIADKYANAHNLGINPDKIYWQSNSQGPYPEWELSQVFDDYSFEDADGEWHDVEFYGRGTTVQSSCFAYDELIPENQAIVDDITSAAQQFIDDVWQLINDICQSYPDDEWVQQTMEANPDAFEFTITADGEVKYF